MLEQAAGIRRTVGLQNSMERVEPVRGPRRRLTPHCTGPAHGTVLVDSQRWSSAPADVNVDPLSASAPTGETRWGLQHGITPRSDGSSTTA